MRALGRPTRDNLVLLPNLEDSVRQRNWLCGTADDVVSLLPEVEEKYAGLNR